jgi:hypothetical protein
MVSRSASFQTWVGATGDTAAKIAAALLRIAPVCAERATAKATITAGAVTAITTVNAGRGYTTAPAVTIDGDGADATATVTVSSGYIGTFTVTAGGTGYTYATVTIATPNLPCAVVDFKEIERESIAFGVSFGTGTLNLYLFALCSTGGSADEAYGFMNTCGAVVREVEQDTTAGGLHITRISRQELPLRGDIQEALLGLDYYFAEYVVEFMSA